MAHPECREEVLQLADEVTSTSGIYEFARRSAAREIIIGSEAGMLYRLEKDNPGKAFSSPPRTPSVPT